jgi:hypothetical protein
VRKHGSLDHIEAVKSERADRKYTQQAEARKRGAAEEAQQDRQEAVVRRGTGRGGAGKGGSGGAELLRRPWGGAAPRCVRRRPTATRGPPPAARSLPRAWRRAPPSWRARRWPRSGRRLSRPLTPKRAPSACATGRS